MNPPGVDLLVVDYRSPADLRRMLASIATPDDLEVAVWIGIVDPDGPSADIAREFLAETGLAGKVITWVTNLGYNRAINLLGTLGEHPVIGCLNADVILTPTALPELVDAVLDHPDWGVVGPRQVDRNGRVTSGGIFAAGGDQTKPRHRGWKALHGYEDVRDDAVYVAGSALFLRRTVWDLLTACNLYRSICPQTGPWLDTQHYYGDSYISLHAQAHDLKAVYLGTTTITHTVGGTRVKERDRPDLAHFRKACDVHGIEHE